VSLVTYACSDSIATITMDDGKANVLSPDMQSEIHAALDQAATDQAVVILQGRENIFSGGFDLAVLRSGGPAAAQMLKGGFVLSERLLTFPRPVVGVCPGHAVAMGVFLLLSTDFRIGASGSFRLTANEVAIGLTMPRAAVEILRQRLTPAAFTRSVMLAEVFSPLNAVDCGFLDRVVDPSELSDAAQAIAVGMAALDPAAHRLTKERAREQTLAALREAMRADGVDYDALA
jgi:enoyl-CoA hydratase